MRDSVLRGAHEVWKVPDFIGSTLGRLPQRWLTASITACGVIVAAMIRWNQDDAFISFRYARNLAEGRGLVYNVGEHVEGYTNFLWTVLLSIPYRLGLDPVLFDHVVSLASMAVTILVTIKLASLCFGSEVLGNVTGLVLVGNFTFLAYGTGGLETQFQTALVTVVALLVLDAHVRSEPPGVLKLVAIGAISGAAVLVRMDSVVLLAAPLVVLVIDEVRSRRSTTLAVLRSGALIMGGSLIVVPWIAWRLSEYGRLVPNTAVAKQQPLGVSLLQASNFIAQFLIMSGLVILVPALFVYGRRILRRSYFSVISVSLALWLMYVFAVGSDFMEFRFMVAALPLVSMWVTALLVSIRSSMLRVVAVGILVLALPVHAMGFKRLHRIVAVKKFRTVDNVQHLRKLATEPHHGWFQLGVYLGEAVGGGPEAEEPDSGAPIVAVTAAGALPYSARLTSVDMLGLNDKWVAEHGVRMGAWGLLPLPGHARMAPPSYLIDREVTLVIGQPTARPALPKRFSYGRLFVEEIFLRAPVALGELPASASVVEMPIPRAPGEEDEVMPMIYLTPNPVIDSLIESGRWRQVPLVL